MSGAFLSTTIADPIDLDENTSDAAKAHAKDVLASAGDQRTGETDDISNRQLGGYKATLKSMLLSSLYGACSEDTLTHQTPTSPTKPKSTQRKCSRIMMRCRRVATAVPKTNILDVTYNYTLNCIIECRILLEGPWMKPWWLCKASSKLGSVPSIPGPPTSSQV